MFRVNNRNGSDVTRKYVSGIKRVGNISEMEINSVISKESDFRTNQRKKAKNKRINNLRRVDDTDSFGDSDGVGFVGPFGWKKYIYVDYAASGKPMKSIETFIQDEVLPHYANTHTTVSNTSLQTTMFRNEARDLIRQSVGGMDSDEVIFCGSGATSAVHKLLHAISYPKRRKLIVFVGPFEHHSNILPWREAASKVIEVPINKETGHVDTKFLRENLKKWTTKWLDRKNRLVVGCFSAGSNVTGAVTDDVEITELLHEFGALSFWDYAAAAPHLQINMNPNSSGSKTTRSSKDALFFSGHKFLGGPQTPGVLVVKKHILQNPVPHAMGGGTVQFVTRRGHQYLDNIHEREEGGTPDIVGSIRLGLVFRLQKMVGIQNIVELESQFCRRMLSEWAKLPEIHILGSIEDLRLPCISFLIEHLDSGYFLHHSFVVALLNDLFGIQCRGGCMCAGPYAQTILGIDDKLASLYELGIKNESSLASGLKPGFVRISLSYHSSPVEIEFVIEAVKLIAKDGWKLLPLYKMDKETGSFVYKGGFQPAVTSLKLFDEISTRSPYHIFDTTNPSKTFDPVSILKEARYFIYLISHRNGFSRRATMTNEAPFVNSFKKENILQKLRWFMLPSESSFIQLHSYHPNIIKSDRPFTPITFKKQNDMDSSGFVDINNNNCLTVSDMISKGIIGTSRIGSVPEQIFRIWNTSESKWGRDFEMQRNYSGGSIESSDLSSSGFEDDI